MSVNGITGAGSSQDKYTTYKKTSEKSSEKQAASSTNSTNDKGVIYEKSETTPKTDSSKKTYKPNAELVAKLKSDVENRANQMKTMVEEMMRKQGSAYGKTDDMWKFLAGGNFTVDPATKAQAQADIAEDGYWGVNKTSDRIVEFATALTGGDPAKMEKMRDAFDKGFKMATKSWGKELPEISQKTYDAVMKKFDDLAAKSKDTEVGTV